MEGCKCKIETKKDVHVLMNEGKEEIIFQEKKLYFKRKNYISREKIPHHVIRM